MEIDGVKIQDAGYLPVTEEAVPSQGSTTKDNKPEKRYPTIWVDDKEMPAIKDKELKDECLLIAVVKVKRRTEEETTEDGGGKKERVSMELQIIKAGMRPMTKSPEDMSDEELDEKTK